jgi:hypothetical protein
MFAKLISYKKKQLGIQTIFLVDKKVYPNRLIENEMKCLHKSMNIVFIFMYFLSYE